MAPSTRSGADLGWYFSAAAPGSRPEPRMTRSRAKAQPKKPSEALRRPRADERQAITDAAAAPRTQHNDHDHDHNHEERSQEDEPEFFESLGTPPPLSVREDPDRAKFYLRISPRNPPLPAGAAPRASTSTSTSTSSPNQRARPPATTTSPSRPSKKRTMVLPDSDDEDEEEVDLDAPFVAEHDTPTSTPATLPGSARSAGSSRSKFGLTPGARAGTRVVPGSAQASSSATRLPSAPPRSGGSPTELARPVPRKQASPSLPSLPPLRQQLERKSAQSAQPVNEQPQPAVEEAPEVSKEVQLAAEAEAYPEETELPLAYASRRKRQAEENDEDVLTPRTVREQQAAHTARPATSTPAKAPARFAMPPPRKRARPDEPSFVDALEPGVYIPLPGSYDDSNALNNPFDLRGAAHLAEGIAKQNATLPLPKYSYGPHLTLPPHYIALLELHEAVETSFVSHMATASHTGRLERVSTPEGTMVRLHRVLSYSVLQQLVRQCPVKSTGSRSRALGKVQLAQLFWLWSAGTAPLDWQGHPPPGTTKFDPETLSGLGFVLERTEVDAKTYDWNLGIEAPLASLALGPEVRSASPTPGSPRKTQRAPTKQAPNDLMALMSQWQMGVSARRATVASRLKTRALQHYDSWCEAQPPKPISSASTVVPASNSGSTAVESTSSPSQGHKAPPPTPPYTHSPGRSRNEKRPVLLPSVVGYDPPLPGPTLRAWPKEFNPAHIAPIPRAQLPSLVPEPPKGLEVPPPLLLGRNRTLGTPAKSTPGSSGTPTGPPSSPAPALTRANAAARGASLAERIRAKQAASQARAVPPTQQRDDSVLSRLPGVATALASLFSPASMGMARKAVRKPARDVLNNAQQALSHGGNQASAHDARVAVDMLVRLAPKFLQVVNVPGAGEWFVRPVGKDAWSSSQVLNFLREEVRRVQGRVR